MLMLKNSKQMVPTAVRMLFARNDQYQNYNISLLKHEAGLPMAY